LVDGHHPAARPVRHELARLASDRGNRYLGSRLRRRYNLGSMISRRMMGRPSAMAVNSPHADFRPRSVDRRKSDGEAVRRSRPHAGPISCSCAATLTGTLSGRGFAAPSSPYRRQRGGHPTEGSAARVRLALYGVAVRGTLDAPCEPRPRRDPMMTAKRVGRKSTGGKSRRKPGNARWRKLMSWWHKPNAISTLATKPARGIASPRLT
jgi:hypothetical protein